jgi:integrase
LAAEIGERPGLTVPGKTPLGSFIDRYIRGRTDLRPGTIYLHRLTRKYLTAHFGADTPIDRITRAAAREWQLVLAAGNLSSGKPLAAPTVRGHVVNAKGMFAQAMVDDLIPANPFAHLRVAVPKLDKQWHYVSLSELEHLLAACRSPGWKALIALCRLAGLRRGEALHLPWSAVDFQNRRLTVFAEKTSVKRLVPIVSELYLILIEALEAIRPGQERVCDVSSHCLWRNFTVIRRRAGLSAWQDAFQVMRRNCETDWAQCFPQYVVSEWLGHSIVISAEHYLAVPEELFAKASALTRPP